ncbi:MAG: alpha amylase C-terminal domain-containing protein [Bacteroidales bacterium]|nr:alpha amylase C-terminal domain-containing protein [Bacteroidales bacterium]
MKDLDLVKNDPWLKPYSEVIFRRYNKTVTKLNELTGNDRDLYRFASGHLYFGMHREEKDWIVREWAPNATAIYLTGAFSHWKESENYAFRKLKHGNWELRLAPDKLAHKDHYKLIIHWEGGKGERIPAWCNRVIQDPDSKIFDAQVWVPEEPYRWKHPVPDLRNFHPIIYEAHVGMGTEAYNVGTYREFREQVLPRVIRGGYNTLQLMAIQEHPYYGSFGYHVSNFFAASSRFGTPEELKELIDEAHGHGLAVIMDLVHSHAVKNEIEGLGRFAGDPYQFFNKGDRREHVAWDSLCFDYGKNEVLHFLLSNLKYWLTEYNFDGFRFDGVTSMLYYDHGLGRDFTSYDFYFDTGQDEDAITYLSLANTLVQQTKPGAITIAEDMSGYPGLAAPLGSGGVGFHYRLSMGTPDYWIKTIKEKSDEAWNMGQVYHELSAKRADEKTIGYAESHDQALVGDKTIIFRLIDKEMYWFMNKESQNLIVDRGIALHKMIRLITIGLAGNGYLNFMGNEFGHPEWIDFPREGNNWSFHYARRQWSLVDDHNLKYHYLGDFDRDMIHLVKEAGLFGSFPNYIKTDEVDKVIAFERAGLVFVFNFHPTNSYTDYGIAVDAGRYKILLCSDEPKYGGFGRNDCSMVHRTKVVRSFGLKQSLNLYLPSRSAQVLKFDPIPKVR